MPSLSGWSSLESFLASTTPVVTSPYSFNNLITAFKTPCAFGVEVKLTQDEIIYFLPTLSAISLPSFEYFELNPPHLRPSAYHKLNQLKPGVEPDMNSWMALLWVPINKLPPGKLYGSVLVYYKLHNESAGYLPVNGLLTFKIPGEWTNVYENDETLNVELTNHWNDMRNKLELQAKTFQRSLTTLHHDFNFIISRDNLSALR